MGGAKGGAGPPSSASFRPLRAARQGGAAGAGPRGGAAGRGLRDRDSPRSLQEPHRRRPRL